MRAEHERAKVEPISRLMLPVFDPTDLGGGFVAVIVPSRVEIRQQNCQALHFAAGESRLKPLPERPLGPPQLASFDCQWREWNLSLVPRIQGTRVQWSDDSLTFDTRFLAKGFGAGWGIERLKFWIELADDGSLLVEYRHEQGASGKSFLSSRCKLTRVQ